MKRFFGLSLRRLYWQIYLAFLFIVVIFAAIAMLLWHHSDRAEAAERTLNGIAAIASEVVQSAEERGVLEARLARLGEQTQSEFALYGSDGARLFQSRPSPLFAPRRSPQMNGKSELLGFSVSHDDGARGAAVALALSDGRSLLVHRRDRHGGGFPALLVLLAVVIGIGAYPLARRITKRLETLTGSVEAFGQGHLQARAPVDGRDEIAALASSFNRSADRIQSLIDAQRDTLSAASHELRSPLARVRLGVELLVKADSHRADNTEREALRDKLSLEIDELDVLIEEILIASRLRSAGELEHIETVDLLALAAEEASRFDAHVRGEPVTVSGSLRLLRRAVRNLLDNAERHGGGLAVEVIVSPIFSDSRAGARLSVCDQGPGVPLEEREVVFEPFYRSARGGSTDAGAGSGSGLGLSLVKEIAARHGGTARCVARDGGGSQFEIDIFAFDTEPSWLR